MYGEIKLKWITPEADKMIAHMARVSNPNAAKDDPSDRLINYLIQHRHWSPFEMASMCIEIFTTRDIGRQILRHRSFSFQEFSGRYAAYSDLKSDRDIRMQDLTNRQSSFAADEALRERGTEIMQDVSRFCAEAYRHLLDMGVAKECARAVLPEGMVPTHMYMTGTIRSWIHYIKERTDAGVQAEHQMLARWIRDIFISYLPQTATAAGFVE